MKTSGITERAVDDDCKEMEFEVFNYNYTALLTEKSLISVEKL